MITSKIENKTNQIWFVSLMMFTLFFTPIVIVLITLFPTLELLPLHHIFLVMISVMFLRMITEEFFDKIALKLIQMFNTYIHKKP